MSAAPEVLTSIGCDYITATASSPDYAQRLHSLASALFRHQSLIGNEPKAWGMAGFKGWKCGSVQVGTRDKEVIVRLSSDAAYISWSSLMDHAENVSRMDLQATIRIPDDVTKRIDGYKRRARRDSASSGNRKRVRWVQEHHGGYTLYLGNRQSNVFGRIYDKHAESKMVQHKACIRFEAQYQDKMALYVARELHRVPSPIPHIASYLCQFFQSRAVGLELPYDAGATYSCSRPRSDAEKNLEWLQKSVRPCILRLIDSGLGEEVYRALGLIDDAESK